MDFHSEFSNVKARVMDRMEWLLHLRLLYNRTAKFPGLRTASTPVTVAAFLNSLVDSVPLLPLKDRADTHSSVVQLSLNEVFTLFEAQLGETLTWDKVLDQVIQLGLVPVRESPPQSLDLNELVQISQAAAEPEGGRLSDLHIPPAFGVRQKRHTSDTVHDYSSPRWLSLRVPESSELFSEEEGPVMDLSNKFLVRVPQLHPNVMVLNLENNRLSCIDNLVQLNALQYLNLSRNFISKVHSLVAFAETLMELYLADNQIAALHKTFVFCKLQVMDLGKNKVKNVQDIHSLAQCQALEVLNLKGNPVCDDPGFEQAAKELLGQVKTLNPESVLAYSSFQAFDTK